ncbi:hypothetical protein ES707_09296 [subsurface metagenome]
MSGQNSCQIDRPRPFGSIEAPDSLWYIRVHIHCFRTIAPARRDRYRNLHSFSGKLCRRFTGFSHPPDTGISDDTFDWQAISMATVFAQKSSHSFSQCHRLVFQRLSYPSPPTINNRTNADFRHISNQSVLGCIHFDILSVHFFYPP